MFDTATSQKIRDAAKRLRTRGLLQAGDSLSQRLAGDDQFAMLTVTANQIETVSVAQLHEKIGNAVHHADLLRQHQTAYLRRKDVGALVLNRQPWAGALRAAGQGMPGIFDEQIRHLGTHVALLAHRHIDPETCAFLDQGANAFVLHDHVACLGMTLDRMIFNAELLEKCAKAFVLASSTGKPVGQIPWLIRYIANRRLMKDERHAAKQYALGLVPVFKSAY